ncbi:hypothetical protein CDL12_21912 [Handroanthus impetiginosus]|uniref:Uncharacterized protein n=1 Tax=Handroanthus impetiginosus TaxID=429701 RepID=A0A2G9GJU6_9LAMI|nr:hypothetical protein CDL12_21912 [Handroanthus impetiginosus]
MAINAPYMLFDNYPKFVTNNHPKHIAINCPHCSLIYQVKSIYISTLPFKPNFHGYTCQVIFLISKMSLS